MCNETAMDPEARKKVGKDFFFERQQDHTNLFNFFYDYLPEDINTSNFPQQFFSIVALFAEDSKYNITSLHTEVGKLYIESHYETEAETGFNELMLKYRDGDLIVARVQFIHQHEGKMTSLFEILKNIKNEHGLNRIMIESARTDAMQNWCSINGLKPVFGLPLNYEFR